MRLADLNPRWVGLTRSFDKTVKMGVSFDCPHCREQRIVVSFVQPIDPENLLAMTDWQPGAERQWDRSGDTFETLSLLPSVDASPHWHGRITNGEVSFA
jgi:hypothetical protein